jgi:hypothetical protein
VALTASRWLSFDHLHHHFPTHDARVGHRHCPAYEGRELN